MPEMIRLKKANCKNCYKCIRHCPVKSIRFSGNQAHIVAEDCVLCGQCFLVCPQDAKEIKDDLETAKVLIAMNETVVASVAPSFVANYGVSFEALESALKQLGFARVEQTAIGATVVAREYARILEAGTQPVLISSCCQSLNLMIQKHFPLLLPYLAQVASPMLAHCRIIKEQEPEAKTVFIGPCVAKKDEARRNAGEVDCALTFEDLSRWLEEAGVTIAQDAPDSSGKAAMFPTVGGILETMGQTQKQYDYLCVDGLENCVAALREIQDGALRHCFIEMSACSGSCVGGPLMERRSTLRNTAAVRRYASETQFDITTAANLDAGYAGLGAGQVRPGEKAIEDVLRKMGKTRAEEELNCGSCGYDTCREKAVAVLQGKADLSMCLPFLKEKAESFSSNVFSNTPNAIIVLNDALEVQQINPSALRMMHLSRETDVLGENVVRILDPTDFLTVQETGRTIKDRRVYLAEYNIFVDETAIYDPNYHIFICIMRDVTAEEISRENREQMTQQTIEVTDKVIEKQMRVVQEIASLLGETVSETKVALTKLKESLRDE